jgi:hypothetical protein
MCDTGTTAPSNIDEALGVQRVLHAMQNALVDVTLGANAKNPG